jgi:hypothetical protein
VLLSAAYVAYLVLAEGVTRRAVGAAALAASAPAIWLLSDLIVTGDPLFSLTHTQELAGQLGRKTGLANVPGTLTDNLRGLVRLPVLAAGVVGMGLGALFRDRRLAVPIAVVGLGIVSYVVVGAFDLSLIDRYLLPAALMLSVLAAYACLGGSPAARRPWALALGLVLTLGVAVSLARRADDYRSLGTTIDHQRTIRQDLRDLAPALSACRPVHVHAPRKPALVAYFTGLRRPELERFPPSHESGSYLRPRSAAVARVFTTAGTPGRVPPRPEHARLAAANGSWEVWQRSC